MRKATLTVCMGVPGCGKSKWCRKNTGGALVLSADAIRTRSISPRAIFGKMRREAALALSRGQDVCIDACSLQWRDRQPWLRLAKRFDAEACLVVFTTRNEVSERRDGARRHSAGRHGVYAARMTEALTRIHRERWTSLRFVDGESG